MQKKMKIGPTVSKWPSINPLKFRYINFPAKMRTSFSRINFFHEIRLINKECKYNYIAEIKLRGRLLGDDLRDKTNFE